MAETNDLMLLRYNTQNASHIKTLSPWHQKIIFWSNTLGFDLLGTDNSRKIPEVMEFTHDHIDFDHISFIIYNPLTTCNHSNAPNQEKCTYDIV